MKTRVVAALLSSVGALVAQEATDSARLAERVREEVLDQRHPVCVYVATSGTTTLQFPGRIEAIDGDGFTTKPNEEGGDFVISSGPRWVSVKSRTPGAQQNLNVVIGGQAYAVFIKTVPANDFIVAFHFPGQSNAGVGLAAARSAAPRKPLSTARVISLLDKVKGYPTFSQGPSAAMYIGMDINEPRGASCVTQTDRFEGKIVRVIRDNSLDALGFEAHLLNKTSEDLVYDPNNVGVRVGQEVYQAILGDAPGKIPPHGEQTAFFIVAGSASSNVPNDLSAYNDFTLVVKGLN